MYIHGIKVFESLNTLRQHGHHLTDNNDMAMSCILHDLHWAYCKHIYSVDLSHSFTVIKQESQWKFHFHLWRNLLEKHFLFIYENSLDLHMKNISNAKQEPNFVLAESNIIHLTWSIKLPEVRYIDQILSSQNTPYILHSEEYRMSRVGQLEKFDHVMDKLTCIMYAMVFTILYDNVCFLLQKNWYTRCGMHLIKNILLYGIESDCFWETDLPC